MKRPSEELARWLDSRASNPRHERPEDPLLQGLAETAELLERFRAVERAPDRRARGRAAFIEAGVARADSRRSSSARLGRFTGPTRFGLPRLWAGAALAAMALFAFGLVGSRAAADSLPGDSLYPIKRATEHLLLTFSTAPRREALGAVFVDRRQDEAQRLVEAGREAEISMEGLLAGDPGSFRLNGLPLDLRGAELPGGLGSLNPGAQLRVEGWLDAEGMLHVRRAWILAPAPTAVPRAIVRLPRTPTPLPAPLPTEAFPTASPSPAFLPAPSPTLAATSASPAPTEWLVQIDPEKRDTQVEWEGLIEAIDGDLWTVAGRSFRLGDGRIDSRRGAATIGARVRVQARPEDGELRLLRLIVLDPLPAPESLDWQGRIEAIEAGFWTVAGLRFEITSATRIKGPAEIGRIAAVRALRHADGRLEALEIQVEPPIEVVFEGRLEAFDAETWTVDGQRIHLDAGSIIEGEPWIGASVAVRAEQLPDASLRALHLRVLDAPPTDTPSAQPSPTPAPLQTAPLDAALPTVEPQPGSPNSETACNPGLISAS
jgi:hypothetical protein